MRQNAFTPAFLSHGAEEPGTAVSMASFVATYPFSFVGTIEQVRFWLVRPLRPTLKAQ